jgi:hypothetical protein
VWFDREISAGEDYQKAIFAQLKKAGAVMVCWSPTATDSQYVNSEATYALGLKKYLPFKIAPCELEPPFNIIHTDDLSEWKGVANDPNWIRLVERIARLIGREAVAAAARALATGDEAARYDFARRYPDEPVARKIWASAEARHRAEFEKLLSDARAAAATKIDAERAALDARLAKAESEFTTWLDLERRAGAKGPKPDPLRLVEAAPDGGGDQQLRDQNAALSGALAQAKAREGQLAEAQAEASRLSGELAKARAASNAPGQSPKSRARTWAMAAGVGVLAAVVAGFVWQAAFSRSPGLTPAQQAEVDALRKGAAEAHDRATKLQADLNADQSEAQRLAAENDALRAVVSVGDKKLSDATAALAAASGRATKLQGDLNASQSRAQLAAADLDRIQVASGEADRKLAAATTALAASAENASKLQADLEAEKKLFSGLESKYAASLSDCRGEILFADSFASKKSEWRGNLDAATASDFKLAVKIDTTGTPKALVVQTANTRMRACVLVAFPAGAGSTRDYGAGAGFVFWANPDAQYSVAFFPAGRVSRVARWSGGSGVRLSEFDIDETLTTDYRLEIQIEERSVEFLVNGRRALEFKLPSEPSGSGVGLFAISKQPLEIEFRDFIVTK